MQVRICSINSKYIHAALAPWYLKVAALEAGFRDPIDVIETNINQSDQEIMDRIFSGFDLPTALERGNQPSLLLAFCCHIWNISLVKRLIPKIAERLPQVKFVLGGPEVSFNGAEVLSALPQVGYVICGEGEKPFAQLLLTLQDSQGSSFEAGLGQIGGLCFRPSLGGVCCNPIVQPEGQPASPYTQEFLEQVKGRIVYFESSRGCPFSCSFCLSGRRDKLRFFDLEQAKGEILRLANCGSRTIKFVDRTFNCHPGRTREIIRFILDHALSANPQGAQLPPEQQIPAGVCFHFEVGADLFDEVTLALLNGAPPGLFQLEAGIQSFNLRTLEAVARQTCLSRLSANIQRLLQPGNIHIHVDLIAGLPYEDLESFGRSFDQAYGLAPQMLQLGFLKMLHGSKLRQQAEALGYQYSLQPPYTYISNPWLKVQDSAGLKLCEDALDRLYNSGRFAATLTYVLEASHWSPFQLFWQFGAYAGWVPGIGLDHYTALFFKFGCGLPGVVAAALRDHLVCDRLGCDNSGQLPQCLRIPDPQFKKLVALLGRLDQRRQRERFQKGEKPNQRRRYGCALLYANGTTEALIADYERLDPVSGHYALHRMLLQDLDKLIQSSFSLLKNTYQRG